jgi:hypothetical protein
MSNCSECADIAPENEDESEVVAGELPLDGRNGRLAIAKKPAAQTEKR